MERALQIKAKMTSTTSRFKKRIAELNNAISAVEKVKVEPDANEVLDYKAGRAKYLQIALGNAINGLKKDAWGLVELRNVDEDNRYLILEILKHASKLKKDMPIKEIKQNLAEISRLSDSLKGGARVEKGIQFIDIPPLPEEIKDSVAADLNEIRKCFEAEAYRSCVVLCGRILETSLQRKYYEVTGIDLSETSPGIGLGKLIAKLSEKEVEFDPGLTQQIHLINQVRVYSVHSKKEAFYPSKGQAQAMILYTLDVLKKLF